MRNMAFFLTTTTILNHTKTHTIRTTWDGLQPNTLIQAVVRSRLTRKGEQLQRLAVLKIVSVTKRPIESITQQEVIDEGFPDWTPPQFIAWFCTKMKCLPQTHANFIRFTYES